MERLLLFIHYLWSWQYYPCFVGKKTEKVNNFPKGM